KPAVPLPFPHALQAFQRTPNTRAGTTPPPTQWRASRPTCVAVASPPPSPPRQARAGPESAREFESTTSFLHRTSQQLHVQASTTEQHLVQCRFNLVQRQSAVASVLKQILRATPHQFF